MRASSVVKVRKMPKRPPKAEGGKAERKQYNVGVDKATAERIDATAEALGLDGVNFLRMVIRENLAKYEKRAAQVREGEAPE